MLDLDRLINYYFFFLISISDFFPNILKFINFVFQPFRALTYHIFYFQEFLFVS